jgi:hypothetical protein
MLGGVAAGARRLLVVIAAIACSAALAQPTRELVPSSKNNACSSKSIGCGPQRVSIPRR